MSAQHRFVVGILAALALALAAVAPAAALADGLPAPEVTAQAATDVTTTTATLHAQVDTAGTPTTGYFVYGTSPSGPEQRTPEQDLGATGVVPFTGTLTGLTPGTSYTWGVVVENDDWRDSDGGPIFRTLHPTLEITGAVDDIGYTSATLHLHVDTHGLPGITVSGQAGTSRITSLGYPVAVFGSGSFSRVPVPAGGDVAVPLTGLKAGTTYYWAVTPDEIFPPATTTGEFRTTALIAVSRPALSANRVPYGTHVKISGTVAKPGALVTLVEQGPPFLRRPITRTALTTVADSAGAYAFDVRAEGSMRYGVTFDGAVPPTSSSLSRVNVLPAVTARLKRLKHHRFRVTGSYAPDVSATVSLYRRGAGLVGLPRESEGTFRFPARTLKPGTYEVRVTPDSRPSLVLGARATITVPRR